MRETHCDTVYIGAESANPKSLDLLKPSRELEVHLSLRKPCRIDDICLLCLPCAIIT